MSQDPVPKSDNRTYTVKPLQGTMPAEAADFLCFQRSRRIPSNLTAEHKPGPTCGFLAGEGAHPAEPVEASEGARRGSTPQGSALTAGVWARENSDYKSCTRSGAEVISW